VERKGRKVSDSGGKGGSEGGKEGGKEGRREGRREGGREGGLSHMTVSSRGGRFSRPSMRGT
jgi:hypothetical protein